jgi:hypothetical protein
MKVKKIIIILLVISFLALALPAVAGKLGLKVFVDNKQVPVNAIEQDGEVYISLNDLSKVFPGKINLDAASSRLDISNDSVSSIPASDVGKPVAAKGISGSISLKEGTGKEFFLKKIKVRIYSYSKEIPEDVSLTQLKQMAAGSGSDYQGTHGIVRETISDESGNFYFESVSPGKYELVGIYSIPGGKKGYFWRTIINVEKDKPLKIDFSSDNVYRF